MKPERSEITNAPDLGDLPEAEFRLHLQRVTEWAIQYRSSIETRPVSSPATPGALAASFPASIPVEPIPLNSLLDEFEQRILPSMVHWGHPSFLGYFGSTTTAPGIVGEVVAAALNVSAMTWATSPAATELETVVLNWLRKLVGLPESYFGVVYDTASVGILHALAAARESIDADIRNKGLAGRQLRRMCVYASDQAHSSITKAAITLGIGARNVRSIKTDKRFRMNLATLHRAVREDRAAGYLPLAVVATVGTTSAAAIDPVPEIANLCRDEKLWLHVDAAYGGAAGLLPETRHFLDGVSRADSVIVNPHKWFFVPLDFSVLFIRRPQLLRQVFSLVPEYLQGDADQSETNYMDYGIQLGRRFRALKAWMVFSTFGEKGLIARIREQIRLAKLFAHWILTDKDFELLAPVHLNVVCFRAVVDSDSDAPATPIDLDKFNQDLARSLNATGRIYLTHTTLHSRVALRIAVGNILTTEKHLADAFALIKEAVERARDHSS